MSKRLLVFDCHEAWVYQLQALNRPMDVVIGLRGRTQQGWDEKMRPVPSQACLLSLEEVMRRTDGYDCIVAHNLTDLLDVRTLCGPRLLILHETLDGTAKEQGLSVPVEAFRETVARFVRLTHTHVVAVSSLKGRSWGFEDDIVPSAAEPSDYPAWTGTAARGLRVANHILRRPNTLLWDFHLQAFQGLPVTLVGRNEDMKEVEPAANWEHLKEILSEHRFYIHTADPRLEDGYNMATMEAMAAGLPVVGNRHPSSPVEHGVSGFLSDDPSQLRAYAVRLLNDRGLAMRMGAAARESVVRQFSVAKFKQRFCASIERARQVWLQGNTVSQEPCSSISA